jgi:AcrR family transcriptional regulator
VTDEEAPSNRQRIIDAAIDLLEREGRDAVTTRAVASAAGVQAPTIYRLFGDKDGLLAAIADHGYTAFVAAKSGEPVPRDPVESLRAGWDLAVEFGLRNPELYLLLQQDPDRARDSAAGRAGLAMLHGRITALAAAGLLRVDEQLALGLIQATAIGAVLTWLRTPVAERDARLVRELREAMVAAVTTVTPAIPEAGAAGAARALRASLDGQGPLSEAERALFGEWLDRIAAG